MHVSGPWFQILVCAVGLVACDFPPPPDVGNAMIDAAVGDTRGDSAPVDSASTDSALDSAQSMCGNGVMDPGEECDDPTLPANCPYSPTQTVCSVCNASCKLVAGVSLFCGDGIVHAPEEKCDGGDRGCGACSMNCQTVISQPATGLIVAAAGNAFVTGDRFTLGDGTSSVTFEYTLTGSVDPGRVPILIETQDNTAAVIIRTTDAINGSLLHVLVDNRVGGTAHLRHERATATGNVVIDEHVMTSDFAVDGMKGGTGGLCLAGKPCKSSLECASNVCDGAGQCAAP